MEMSMRKLVWITVAIAALAGAGMAVAHHADSKSVKAVSATFTATTPSVVKTNTCTGADGTYVTTDATYTGTSTSSEAGLNGAITIETDTLLNTTTNLGEVSGKIRFGSGHGNDTHFDAVLSNGNIAGLASGHVDGGGTLLANISAGFTSAGGFTTGKLGGGTSGGDGVEILRGGCKPAPAPKPDTITARGAVAAVPTTTITVAGVTCTIPPTLAAAVTALNLVAGTQVEMTCTSAAGVNTLTKISAPGHHDVKVEDHGKHCTTTDESTNVTVERERAPRGALSLWSYEVEP
jgi:hypothetical protein